VSAKKPRRRRYDSNFKAEVLDHLKGSHTKLSDVAKRYGIPENTLREWTKLDVVRPIETAREKFLRKESRAKCNAKYYANNREEINRERAAKRIARKGRGFKPVQKLTSLEHKKRNAEFSAMYYAINREEIKRKKRDRYADNCKEINRKRRAKLIAEKQRDVKPIVVKKRNGCDANRRKEMVNEDNKIKAEPDVLLATTDSKENYEVVDQTMEEDQVLDDDDDDDDKYIII